MASIAKIFLSLALVVCVLGEFAYLMPGDGYRYAFAVNLENGDVTVLSDNIYGNDIEGAEFIYGNEEMVAFDGGEVVFRYKLKPSKEMPSVKLNGNFFIDNFNYDEGDITASCDGRVWIANGDGNIYHYDREYKNVTWFAVASCDGLAYSEEDGLLYCSAYNGLWSIDTNTGVFTSLFALPNYFGDGSLAFGQNGTLYLLTGDRLFVIDIKNQQQIEVTSPGFAQIKAANTYSHIEAMAIQKRCKDMNGKAKSKGKSNYSYSYDSEPGKTNMKSKNNLFKVDEVENSTQPEKSYANMIGGAVALFVGVAVIVVAAMRYRKKSDQEAIPLL